MISYLNMQKNQIINYMVCLIFRGKARFCCVNRLFIELFEVKLFGVSYIRSAVDVKCHN